jgi:hypothetical protein
VAACIPILDITLGPIRYRISLCALNLTVCVTGLAVDKYGVIRMEGLRRGIIDSIFYLTPQNWPSTRIPQDFNNSGTNELSLFVGLFVATTPMITYQQYEIDACT